jgi:tetratricopeptide (TPR) repeat protein
MSKKASGKPSMSGKSGKSLLDISTPSFLKAVDDAKLVHGPSHIKLAQAYNELGEHYFKKEDLVAAKENLEISLKMQADLAGGKFSRGAYTWKDAIPPEEFLDTHYRLGQVIAAQAKVTGSSEDSKKHLIKTLGMREAYDDATPEQRDTVNAYKTTSSGKEGTDVIGLIGSALDSTLVYMDQAEEARIQGDFKEASFLLLKAINLRRKKFGPNSTACAQVLSKYSEVLRVQFKYSEGREVLDEVLAIYMAAYGPEHAMTCDALNSLGQMHRLLGNLDDAESLLLEAFNIRRRLLGDHHVSTASSLNNLAELSRERGDYFQAINYHIKAVDAFTASVGENHPGTVNAKGNMGVTLRRQAKKSLEEGEMLVKDAFEQLQVAQYDDAHPWVVKFGMENIIAQAQKLQTQGKFDESVALYDSLIDKKHVMAQMAAVHESAAKADAQAMEEVKSITGSVDGDDIDEAQLIEARRKYRKPANQDLVVLTEGRVVGLMAKAKNLLTLGRYAEAEQTLRDSVPSSKVVLGEENLTYFRATLMLIEVKQLLGMYDECNALLSALLQLWTDLKGPDHVEVAEVAAVLAEVYVGQGLYDAASTLFAQVVEVIGHKLQYDPLATRRTGSTLNVLYCQVLIGVAGTYTKQSYFADAITSLKQAKAVFTNSVDDEHPLHIEYQACYGRLRLITGQPALAQSFFQNGLDRALRLYNKQHPRVAQCMYWLAESQIDLGKWAEAASYIEEGLYIRSKHLPDEHPDIAASERAKASLLVTLGSYEDALVFAERALVNQRTLLGQRHPEVAATLAVLAEVSLAKGQPKQARDHLQLSLDVYRECLGHLESHDSGDAGIAAEGENALMPNITIVEANQRLGEALLAQGNPLQAVAVMEKVRSDREVVYAQLAEIQDDGEEGKEEVYTVVDHPRALLAMLSLGRVYLALAMLSDAHTTITEAGAALVKLFGEKSAAAGEAVWALADVSCAHGMHRDAQVQYSHAYCLLSSQLNASHPRLLAVLSAAANNMYANGYIKQVLDTTEYVLSSLERQLPGLDEKNSLVITALQVKGRALTCGDASQLPAAEKCLEKAMYAARGACGGKSHSHASAMLLLAECLLRTGKAEKVEPVLKQAITIGREVLGGRDEEIAKQTKQATLSLDTYYDTHPFLGEIMSVYAAYEGRTGRPGKANDKAMAIIAEQVQPLYEKAYGLEHPVYTFAEGLQAKYANIGRAGSGKDRIKAALKKLQLHGDPAPEGPGQYSFPADSEYVTILGGYDDFYHNYMSKTTSVTLATTVHPLSLWAMNKAVTKALANPDPISMGGEEDDALSRLSIGSATAATGLSVVEEVIGDAPVDQCLQLRDVSDPEAWGRVGGLPAGYFANKTKGGGSSSNSVASNYSGSRRAGKAPAPPLGNMALMVFNGEAPVSAVLEDLYAGAPGADPEEAKRIRKRERERQEREAAAAAELAAEAELQAEKDMELDNDEGSVLTEAEGMGGGRALTAEEVEQSDALRAELVDLMRRKEQEEEAVQAVRAQKEEQEQAIRKMREEIEAMERAREEHRQELDRVQAELLARKEADAKAGVAALAANTVECAVEEGVKLASRPNSAETAGFPSVDAPNEDASLSGFGDDEDGQPPIVVAVSTYDIIEGEGLNGEQPGGSDKGGDAASDNEKASRPATEGGNDEGVTEVSAEPATPATAQPVAPSSDGMARVAMEASLFLYDRAMALEVAGWYSKSKPIFQECLGIRDQYAQGQPALCQAVIAVAENLMNRCKFGDATLLLARAKELRIAECGGASKSRDIAYVVFLQAKQQFYLSQYTKASKLFLDAVKMLVDTMPSGDAMIGRAICLQSLNTAAQGKLLEAKAQAEKGYAILAKACGTKRVELAEGFMARIRINLLLGKPKEAFTLLQQTISLRKRLLGNEHPLVLETLEVQVQVLMEHGKFAECEEFLDQAMAMATTYFYDEAAGSDDIRMSNVKVLQARYFRVTGRHLDAEQRLLTALQVRRAWIKPLLLIAARKEKERKEAEERKAADLAVKEKEQAKKSTVGKSRVKASVKATSGMSLEDDEDLDAPLPVVKSKEEREKEEKEAAERAAAQQREDEAEIADATVVEVLQELVLVYRALGDGASAQAYLEQLEDMTNRLYKEFPTHPVLAEVIFAKAERARGFGDYDTATALMTHALDMIRRSCGKDHPRYTMVQAGVADILTNKGQHDEAEAMFRKVIKTQKAIEMAEDSIEVAYVNNSYAECLRLRGNAALAKEATDDVLAHRQMLFHSSNADHVDILESISNRNMLALEAIIPPPEDEAVTNKPGDDDDDDDEDGGDEQASRNDMSVASSAGPSIPEGAPQPEFEIPSEKTAAALVRDEEGVPIFDNSAFEEIRETFATVLNRLSSQVGPVLAARHPLAINVTGNIAIVDKLEAEEKERFLFSLVKADRKVFLDKEKKERRKAAAAAAAIASGASVGSGDGEEEDEGEGEEKEGATITGTVTGGGVGSVVTADTNNTRGEILAITSTQANVPEDERVPLFLVQLDAVMTRLRQVGFTEDHAWMRKFRSYRQREVKAPSEMSVALERLREAERMRKSAEYAAADYKYDEALTCQIEFLGRLKAAEDPNVGMTLLLKAENARTVCALERSRKLYNQAYAVWLRADGGGEESEGCLKALQGLGELLLMRGQVEHAQMLFQRVFAARKRCFAVPVELRTKDGAQFRDSPAIVQSLHALGRVALHGADLNVAEKYSRQAFEMMARMERDDPRQYFIDDYGNTADIRLLQAEVCIARGSFSAAETLLKASKLIRSDVNACGEEHPDNAGDWVAMARVLVVQDRLHDARKLVGKAMRTRLKYFGKITYNMSKLSMDSRAFLDTVLDSASYPPETALEDKRLVTMGANSNPLGLGRGGEEDASEGGVDPDDDADVASMIGGSVASSLGTGMGSASNAGAGRGAGADNAQYAAAQAVVSRALEVPRDLDGHKIPAFRWKGVPVSNHVGIAEALYLRGKICRLLGDFEESKLMTESCLNIRKDLFGRKSVPVSEALFELADFHATTGILAEALALHVVALDIRRQFLLGSEQGHPLVADSMLAVGGIKIMLSRLGEGRSMLTQVVTMRETLYGADSAQYAEAQLSNVLAMLQQGQYDQAGELNKNCLVTFKRCYNEPHSLQAACLRVEARVQLALGVTENAHAYVDQAYAQYSSIYAENHLECLETQRLSAEVLIARGRYLEAKAPLETVLTAHKEKFGKTHRETAATLLSIGVDLAGLGKYVTALPILERATQLLRRALGEEHLSLSYAYDHVALCHMHLSHYPRAKALFDRARLIRTRVVGEDHPGLADSEEHQGRLDLLHGHLDAALRHFDDATALRRKVLRSMHPAVADALQATGETLFAKARYPEARSAFERALKMRRTVLHAEHAAIVETAAWLGRLSEVAGKLDQASAIYERCLMNVRNALGSRHPAVAFVLTLLGEVSNSMGNYDLARSYLLDSLVIRTDIFGSVGDPAEEANMQAKAKAQAAADKKALEAAGAAGLGRKAKEEAEAKTRAAAEEYKKNHKCYHPELVSTLMAMADNLRLRGYYGAWEGEALANKTTAHLEENKEKEEEYNREQARLAELNKRGNRNRMLTDAGGGSPTLKDGGADDIEEQEIGEEQHEDDDHSVASVGLETGDLEGTLETTGQQLREEHGSSTLRGHTHPDILPNAPGVEAAASAVEEGSVVTTNSAQAGWTLQDSHTRGLDVSKHTQRLQQAQAAALGDGNDMSVEPDDASLDGSLAPAVRRKHDISDYAEYEFAMPMYERCLEILLAQFGAEHPVLFRCQFSIGATLLGMGNYSLAHDLHQHVLIHRRRMLGDEHLDTVISFVALADMLRFLSFVYPSNTAAAAEKRNKSRKIKVGRSLGPSLMEHLGSILGDDKRLKEHWPPQVSHELSLVALGKHPGPNPHPLLAPKYPQPERAQGGYMGYSFPSIKKLARDSRAVEGKVTRPDHSKLNDAKWLYDHALKVLRTAFNEVPPVHMPEREGSDEGDNTRLPPYPCHPVIADALYGKAELMRQRRDNDTAIDLQEHALAMRRNIVKSSHVSVSDCLMSIAESLRFENRFKKAESLLLKCVQIREAAFAEEDVTHPCISEVKCCLAMLYYAMGTYEECMPLYTSSLRERERVLGPNHIATAQSLNNLAGFLHTTGRYQDALPLYRRTLKIKRETFGDEHSDVASAKNNLGLLLKAMGQHDEAITLYEQALDTLMAEFGKYHADVGSTLNNMAALYVAIGDTRKGRVMYRDALMVKKKVLGLDHVGVAAALNNLAGLCFSCGDIEEAKDYYEESLRIRREKYGDDHPTVAESINNIGLLLFSLGEYTNAQPLFERAIIIKKATYGPRHMSTASSMHNYAILLHKLKRFADAEKMYTQALQVRTDTLGADHPDTVTTLENLQALGVDKERLGTAAARAGTAAPTTADAPRPYQAPHGASGTLASSPGRPMTGMPQPDGRMHAAEQFGMEQSRLGEGGLRGKSSGAGVNAMDAGIGTMGLGLGAGFEFLERGAVPLGPNGTMTSLTRESEALLGRDPMDLGLGGGEGGAGGVIDNMETLGESESKGSDGMY